MKRLIIVSFFCLFIYTASLEAITVNSIPQGYSFFESATVFEPLTDGMGYHNYRIPSLLLSEKGTVLAVMEGREDMNSDHAKNDLVLKRSMDLGETWTSPSVIAEAGDNVTMNPVMVQATDGTILLVYIYFPEKRHSSNRAHGVTQVDPGIEGSTIEKIYVIRSNDEGETWSHPEDITHVAKSSENTIVAISGPGVGVTLTRGKYVGRVIIPMSETTQVANGKSSFNYALYSDDNGKSWTHGESCPASIEGASGGDEVQMIELEDGSVFTSIRSVGHKLVSQSKDGGHSWSQLQSHSDLPDTGCMSPLLRVNWKNLNTPGVLMQVLVTDRLKRNRRGNAVIALSLDDGQTWPTKKIFYDQEFDYSSLILFPDGKIGMLAEYDFDGERAKIKFVKFDSQWIEKQ